MAISGMPVIGRHTKLGHGHLLNVWKAPEGPDTLEISHDSGFRTESPENPVELGLLTFIAQHSKYQYLRSS